METRGARQILVTQVEEGSPAARDLRPGDVILGIGDAPFADDARIELGKAITQAEADGGRLRLMRWRKGKTREVVVRLRSLGAYGPTAPYDCPKSKRIFEQGCKALAQRMKDAPDRGNPIERCLGALALLASGKRNYLPLVREQVAWAAQYSDLDRKDLHSWWYGYVNLLVAQYVLTTQDARFKKSLRRLTMEIVQGQSAVGSWGHRFIQPGNGRLAGYGMMNAPGLPLTASLVLARQAGVSDPALDEAIARSARLIRFYVGKGSVPYGDHHPWLETHDDNGKNGIAALLFNLLGDAPAAEYFSRMSVACHGGERDLGHTGNYFNMLWALPGVALSGPHATGAWMKEFGWSYDLARRWDGTFTHQGPPEPKPDSYKGWDSTGAYLLAYGLALGKLPLLGTRSVVPQLDAAAAEALVADGRDWSPAQKDAPYAGRSEARLLAGLRSWSPVVRERCGLALARREGDPTALLIALLEVEDPYARLGACQALAALKKRAAPAVPALRRALRAEDLWLRIKAADALAAIGPAALPAVADLLAMLVTPPSEADPRGMQQRYLCFALFDRRDGLLGRSLDGVDRQALHAAVVAGLRNEDGRARGSLESVFRNLSYEELAPILPAVHQAILEPAPSGIMFADGIRLSGLELLAKHRIREGVALCLDLVDVGRWGLKDRLRRCLTILRSYGGAARGEIPRIRELETRLAAAGWKPGEIQDLKLGDLVEHITNDPSPPTLRPLERAGLREGGPLPGK